MCVCVYIRIRLHVYSSQHLKWTKTKMCSGLRTTLMNFFDPLVDTYTHTYTYTYMHIYTYTIYIYIYNIHIHICIIYIDIYCITSKMSNNFACYTKKNEMQSYAYCI